MRRLVFALSCAALSCSNQPTEVKVGEEFVLTLGQSVVVSGTEISITFSAVPQDSRCPVNVVCIWAGNAEVRLTLYGGLPVPEQIAVLNTGLEPRSYDFARLELRLLDLTPQPVYDQPQSELYRARLQIVRK